LCKEATGGGIRFSFEAILAAGPGGIFEAAGASARIMDATGFCRYSPTRDVAGTGRVENIFEEVL